MEQLRLNAENLEASRIRQAAADVDRNSEKFTWQLGQLASVMPQLRQPEMRKGVAGIMKGYLIDYRHAGTAVYDREINVALPVDSKIPFERKSLPTYMSFVGLAVSAVNFLKKEFGEKAKEDVSKFVNDLAGFYPEATEVFREAQTSFARSGDGGLKFKLLRLIDSNKNASPSLHVMIAAHTCSRLSDILDRQAQDPESYEPIKKVYFEKAVAILEAILLVKQHMVMDIGVGLAALSGRDRTFSKQRAEQLTNAMFQKDPHGMDQETVTEIHQQINSIYDQVVKRLNASPQAPQAETIVKYLKDFDARKI